MNRKKKNWQQLFAEMQQEDPWQRSIGVKQRKSQTTYDQDDDGKIDDAWLYSQAENIVNALTNPASAWDNQSSWGRKPYDYISNAIRSIIEPVETLTEHYKGLKNPLADKFTPKDQRDKWYQNWIETDPLSQEKYTSIGMARTAAATYLDIMQVLGSGVMDSFETLIDTPAYGVSTVAGLFSKDAQNAVDQFIAKDLLKSDAFGYGTTLDTTGIAAPLYKALVPNEEVLEENSIIGDKTEGLLQSGVQLAETYALNALGVPADVTQAVFAFGSEAESALQNGAGHWQAGGSAAISAAGAVLTEMLFKGSLLDDLMGNKGFIDLGTITSGVKNKVVKSLADYGIDAVAEGVEEVVDNFISSLGSLLYEAESPEEIISVLKDKNSFNNIFTAFAGGFAMSGIGNTGKIINSVATNSDYRTGLTAGEQSVFDKAFEQAMKDAEAETGKKPTGKEKTKLYGQTMEQMQKGYISTDTIGEVLDTETYTKYKDVSDQISQLQPEYDRLYNMKTGEKTDAQIDRQKELKQQLDELKQQRTELDGKLESLAKGTKLEESYKERTRRRQAFQAESAQYENEYARQTVKNIVDSGVVNNTNRTHELVDLLTKVSADRSIVFSATDAKKLKETGFAIGDATVNGYYTENGIAINVNSPRALNTVVGHEITHALEGSEFYDSLKDVAISFAKSKGDYDSRMAALVKMYTGKQGYETDFDAKMEKELVADLIGEYVFNDADFVRSLSTQDQKLFQKIYEEIMYLCKASTAGSKEARQLEKVKKIFAEVYRDTKNTAHEDGNVKYSLLVKQTNGNEDVVNPEEITKKDVLKYMNMARRGQLENYTYFPVRANTPSVIINTLHEAGVDISDKPLAMQAKKARQSQLEEIPYKKNGLTVRHHAMNPEEILEVIDKLERPQAIIHQQSRTKTLIIDGEKRVVDAPDSFAVFVELDSGQECVAIIEFDSEIDNKYVVEDGYGDEYHTTVTVFRPDVVRDNEPFDYIEYLLMRDSNRELEIINEGSQSETAYSETHATVFEKEPSNKKVSHTESSVKQKFSLSDSDNVANESNPYGKDVALDEAVADADEQTVTEQARSDESLPADDSAADTVNREQLERILGSKASYTSESAGALYEELRNLKKGVRASSMLSGILDYFPDKSEWGSVRTALLNIRDNPNETVNPNSRAEAIARELLGREYETSFNELAEMQRAAQIPEKNRDAKDCYLAKLYGLEQTRANKMRAMQIAYENSDFRISALKSEYETVKNTDAGNQLLNKIAALKNDRDTAKLMADEEIDRLSSTIVKMMSDDAKTAIQRQIMQEKYFAWAENLVGDTSKWKDKRFGWQYKTNTLRRNLRDVVKDANEKPNYAQADAIFDELQGRYNRHEAEMNRELTQLREKYANLKITKAEDAYIQMLGEFRHNPTTTLTEDVIKEYYEKHKKHIDSQKVDQIIEMARQDYDALLQRVNQVLKEQGIKTIPYRKGYFPHFTLDKQGPLAKLLNWKTRNDDIPTDIAGLTESFEPNRSYQHFDKQRTSDDTDYSFSKGFDQYSFGAMDWIYHIEDIRKRRALENYIRYVHSDEGVKAKINAIKNNESYDADEAQMQMDAVYEEAKNPLNNFVIDLRRGTQTLSAKKSSLDREAEENLNRKIYSTMTNISNRVSANMIAGSISAAMTNFVPITQSWGTVNPLSSAQAMAQTMQSAIRDDGTIDKSAFLTNRLRKAENLYKTGWDKVSDKISILMNAIDSFSSQTVWRSKYYENIASGMGENAAIRDADLFAASVMADRSRGNMPTIFDSKNLITKTMTSFQLEVANQYGYLFKDMPQEEKNKNIARLAFKYTEVFVGAYVLNSFYKAVIGRTVAFDPFRIITDLIADIFEEADKENEEQKWYQVADDFIEDVLQEVPFIGGLFGGGRIPISSALPYGNAKDAAINTWKEFENYFKSTDSSKPIIQRVFSGDSQYIKNLTKEWLNPAAYALMPMGGGQLKKTIEGLLMYLGNKPVAGSYTTDGNLRYDLNDGFFRLPSFPQKLLDRFAPETGEAINEIIDDVNEQPLWQGVENATNFARSTLFGQWSSRNAQEYIDQGRKPLSQKQTEEFVELDIPIQQYWDIRDNLNRIDKSDSKTKQADKVDFINSLDLTVEQKNILVNNILDRKENVDMTDYDKFGSFAEFDFSIKNPEKYAFLKQNNISYADYAHDKDAYNWAYENPGKYALSKAFLINYTQYNTYRKNIAAIESGKDQYGQTISNSQRQRRIAYINSLPITKLEKAILIKQFYPSYTDADQMISMYINSSQALSPMDKYIVLYELGLQTSWNGGSYQ